MRQINESFNASLLDRVFELVQINNDPIDTAIGVLSARREKGGEYVFIMTSSDPPESHTFHFNEKGGHLRSYRETAYDLSYEFLEIGFKDVIRAVQPFLK